MTSALLPDDAQAPPESRFGAWAYSHLRWILHGALLLLAVLMAVTGGVLWHGETRRVADVELVGLVGAQRMLSQRVPLLVVQPTADSGTAFVAALDEARRGAARIEQLLGMHDRMRFAELSSGLVIAALRWQTERELLWEAARGLALGPDRSASAPPTTALPNLMRHAQATLDATEEMVMEIQRQSHSKSQAAVQRLGLVGEIGAAVLFLLALLGVEPAARFVRRQHLRQLALGLVVERLRLVAAHVHDAVVVTDAEHRVVWVNRALTTLCGFSPKEATGRKLSDLLQTEQSDHAALARFRTTLDAGEAAHARLLNRARDGRLYWLDIDVQPLLDPSGRISGFIAIGSDASERVRHDLRLQTILDTLPTGVVEQDGAGVIVHANRAAQEILGLTRQEVVGRLSVDDRWRTVREDLSVYPGDEHAIARSLRDGSSERGDRMGLVTPQGSQRWLWINSEPVRDQSGAIAGAVCCISDVTEQRAQRTLLQLALEVGNIGTWHWRLDGAQREWSAESCSMLGYGVEEFEPLLPTWRERVHPEDRAAAEAELAAYLSHPVGFYRHDMRIRHRAGHWVWVQTFGAVVERDLAGNSRSMIGVHLDISERKRQEMQLQSSALQDSLTGLPNRAALLRRMRECIACRALDHGTHVAVLFLGVDRFKQINDALGHAGGDELLVLIGQRLLDVVRDGQLGDPSGVCCQPMVARLGGDEFAMLLTGLGKSQDAAALADRLQGLIGRPYDIGGKPVYATAGIGIVATDMALDGVDKLLDDAETASREAKRSGRGQWMLFEPDMRQRAVQRAETEADLHLALARDEIFVVYQPVLALGAAAASGRCAGVEALVRWQHPVRGLVGPMEFIPIAEESGQIAGLGRFVLDAACRDFMEWRLALGDAAPASLAVNLSVAQLRQAGMVEEVRLALQRHAMPAACLQLEVTESLAAQDPAAQTRLRELKGLGVRLALDDFGTGYSSLSCLHQMPVDTVKIDRSFVIEAERSEYHRALIDATVRVAHTLRMVIVAEGVETAQQAELVTALGCDKGQGYLYSKPLTSADLVSWLQKRRRNFEVATGNDTLSAIV